jgi:glycosyltransferase involved in cell wall biosynthesis
MKIVASLTTIPSRIDRIKECLESLLAQTIPINHVEINIPQKCVRTGEDYVIPEWMKTMERVQIFRTSDYGSITKIVPTFFRYKDDIETFIWSVDDDWKYPNFTLEKLVCEHDPKNVRILAHSGVSYDGSKILYLHGGSRISPIVEGVTTILYPPRCIQSDFAPHLDIVLSNPDCRKSDDLILSNYFAKIGMKSFLTAFTTDKALFHEHIKYIQAYEGEKDALRLQDDGHRVRYVRVIRWLKKNNLFFLDLDIPSLPTIGLCMIVKDESHIIHEALQSTLALIDTYSIVDTGSSDNTIEIIKDFYKKHNITGEVHERSWKGFGESRTEALRTCDGKMDYILMMDADDLMVFPPQAKETLVKVLDDVRPNACNIEIRRGLNNSLEYHRTQIFKANDDWKYVGVLHEYPTNGKPCKFVKLPKDIFMVGRTIGNRTKIAPGIEKYKKDAEILLAELEKEPENDRYVFYLAQSYRDAGMTDEAVKWYKKRFEMGKWKEEMFVSAYNISKLLHDKDWAWKAHEICPYRTESLVTYATQCRVKNMWSQEVFAMLVYAATISKPTQDCLFIESDVYLWRVFDELAIYAAFTGHKEICKQTCIRLLHERQYPASEKQRIENNLKACF